MVACADIAHRGAQAADELVQDVADRALVGHLALDAFGHQLQRVLDCPAGSSGRPSRAPSRRPSPCRDRPCRSGPGRGRPRPALSSVPASSEPTMAQSAPAAIALARSPEYLMPPSAITGTPAFCAASTASMMAVSCGTPTPATMRVVQIEPGPMPTLTASAPASISACAPSAVATLPAMTCAVVRQLLDARHRFEHAAGMAVRGVDHDHVDAGVDQQLGALRSRRRRRRWPRRRAGGPARPCWRSG